MHNSTQPDAVFENLRQIADARSRGRDLYGQVSCCPLTVEFTLKAPYPFEGIASWAPAMKADEAGFRALLGDAGFRANLKRDLETPIAVRLFNGEWHKLAVVQAAHSHNRHLEGVTLAEIARRESKHPLDAMLDLALAEDLDTIFTATLLNSDEDEVGRLLKDPNSAIALSDAGAHLTFFCDAGFGLRLLGYWVRERGLMPLEAAIAELTSKPAAIYGIEDRGVLKSGAHADLFLFDPSTVDRSPARRVFDLPSGAPRLITDPVGVHGVWVNGVRVADANGYCIDGERPGRLLREFAA